MTYQVLESVIQISRQGGYWVIGKRDAQDCAMYPMIKVFDCADDPAMLEEDSKWFRQECNECDEEDVIGNVRGLVAESAPFTIVKNLE